jgi:hypothetical protein
VARRETDEELLVDEHEDEEDEGLDAGPDGDFEADLDDDDLGGELGDDGDTEADEVDDLEDDDEDDSDESLDAILQKEAPRRDRASDEDDDDEIDFSQPDPVIAELNTRAAPLKDTQEFVCSRCHLVKARSQLADVQRQLCRDCV